MQSLKKIHAWALMQDPLSDKLKARHFNATSLSTYDFSTLYITLPII